VDWTQVCDFAAELDKAVEIDAYPDHQDLGIDLLKMTKKSGCRVSLGTDSQDPLPLRFMEFALAAASIAGLKRERIPNFMAKTELLNWAVSLRDSS
jgi:histidinol phosphatase-like PHP family hydrolase